MRLLAIETSGEQAGLALWEEGCVLAEESFGARMTLCEQLAPHILALLGVSRVAEAGLDAIAVSSGPGSFTSLRVGMATAKALAHCLELALIGVPTSQALAAEAPVEVSGSLWVLQPARKDEYYVSCYERPAAGLPRLLEPATVMNAALARSQARATGAFVVEGGAPAARTIAALGAATAGSITGDEHLTLRPTYVSRSQAEVTFGIDLESDGRRP